MVQAALGGAVATTLLEADRQFNVTVRVAPEYRDSIDAVRNDQGRLSNSGGSNAYIPLSELARISLDTGASYIYHERNQTIHSDQVQRARPRSRRNGCRGPGRIASNVKLPNGYRIMWAGEFEELQQAKARLKIIVPISLALILLLLYALFNSLRDSLMALAGIPFAIGGGVLALVCLGPRFQHLGCVGSFRCSASR